MTPEERYEKAAELETAARAIARAGVALYGNDPDGWTLSDAAEAIKGEAEKHYTRALAEMGPS